MRLARPGHAQINTAVQAQYFGFMPVFLAWFYFFTAPAAVKR
jgi:hypothetical protein